jgi:hypothetical protein
MAVEFIAEKGEVAISRIYCDGKMLSKSQKSQFLKKAKETTI